MTTQFFSVIIKRYMSNLKIMILRPWTDKSVIKSLSRATVHRKRFQMIEELGDKIRQDIINTLKRKRLCLHFDGKQLNQTEDDLDVTVTVERISTVSHHLTLGIQMTFYLELFKQRFPKAMINLILS